MSGDQKENVVMEEMINELQHTKELADVYHKTADFLDKKLH